MIILADYIPSVFQRQKRFNVQPLYIMCTFKNDKLLQRVNKKEV